MSQVNAIPSNILLSSDLLSAEDSFSLCVELEERPWLTPSEIIGIDLPARNRVEALLRREFFGEEQLRELACDFAEHTLHIFEWCCPNDLRPRRFIEIARLYYAGEVNKDRVRSAFIDTWKAIERFKDVQYQAAFASGLAVSLLYSDEAEKMARNVAIWTQNAAHRMKWQDRKSNVQLMIGREMEAVWQLKQIMMRIIE